MKRDGCISQWREAQLDCLDVCWQTKLGSCGQSKSRTDSGPHTRQTGARHCNAPGASGTCQRLQPRCLTSARGIEESER